MELLLVDLSDVNTNKWESLIQQIRKAQLGPCSPDTGTAESPANTSKYACRYKTKPHKRLSKEEITEAIMAYQAGATTRELASKFDCHRNTVAQCLKKNGVALRGRPMSESQIFKAIELYESGLSLVKVSEIVHADAETVRLRLIERGVEMRDPHGKVRNDEAQPRDTHQKT